jgi:hypothetical protein
MNVTISCYIPEERQVTIREEFDMDKECLEDLVETLLEEWDFVTIERSHDENKKKGVKKRER